MQPRRPLGSVPRVGRAPGLTVGRTRRAEGLGEVVDTVVVQVVKGVAALADVGPGTGAAQSVGVDVEARPVARRGQRRPGAVPA